MKPYQTNSKLYSKEKQTKLTSTAPFLKVLQNNFQLFASKHVYIQKLHQNYEQHQRHGENSIDMRPFPPVLKLSFQFSGTNMIKTTFRRLQRQHRQQTFIYVRFGCRQAGMCGDSFASCNMWFFGTCVFSKNKVDCQNGRVTGIWSKLAMELWFGLCFCSLFDVKGLYYYIPSWSHVQWHLLLFLYGKMWTTCCCLELVRGFRLGSWLSFL